MRGEGTVRAAPLLDREQAFGGVDLQLGGSRTATVDTWLERGFLREPDQHAGEPNCTLRMRVLLTCNLCHEGLSSGQVVHMSADPTCPGSTACTVLLKV